ncbi:major facilitator superfamily domain-containing protein [Aspergillus stella-maris]|uniref:major facilitator superfamily domain-containing protein n=1 Tax=Aspergillus stella-maris TaxID=1810926 RepID=UPI003CCCCDEB
MAEKSTPVIATTTPNAPTPQPPPPYSIYTRKEKWILVTLVACAGLFSPLPANIYFPAIPTLTSVFNRSVEDMNLTVTIYLVFQGVGPMLWGPLADKWGRRPLYLVCLSILTASCIGLALCPTSAYWLLLLLRALQAGGCASTIALGAGVIRDIAAAEERGGYFGMFNLGPMLAPCIGPALGGALSDHMGWRSIFWFLAICSGCCLFLMFLCFPETLRAIVGDGSIPPKKNPLARPLLRVVGRYNKNDPNDIQPDATEQEAITTATQPLPTKRHASNPFQLLLYPDVALTLTYTGIIHAVNYTITTTISSSFADIYPSLSETALGLCYLAGGGGMILGSTITGKMLNRDYVKIREKYAQRSNNSDGESEEDRNEGNVPIEYARLRMTPILLFLLVGCVLAWGWLLERKVHLAVPMVLQVILGYTSISILNATMTLMIDIVKAQSSGVIACTNLVRCSLAAILVSLIDSATQKLGFGWTYIVLGIICAFMFPLIFVEIKMGPRWRAKRARKDKARSDDQ